MNNLSIDERALDLMEEAYELRNEELEKVKTSLAKCIDDNERFECLEHLYCVYEDQLSDTIGAFGPYNYYEHDQKTFAEFIEWYLENEKTKESWQKDWQKRNLKAFAVTWAAKWMSRWVWKQRVPLYLKRNEESVEPSVDVRFSDVEQPEHQQSKDNKFNDMPLETVEKWFMQLANDKKQHLTTEQVKSFIDRAFLRKTDVPMLTFNNAERNKGKIIGLFHAFYKHCESHQSKIGPFDKDATADKYIRLLTDHFDNWTFEEVKNNFRSGGNWQKPT